MFTKKYLKRFHPVEVISYSIWFGTLALGIYAPESFHQIESNHFYNIIIIVYMGVLPGALGYVLWSYALKYLKISVASSFLYIMPAMTLFLGWILLGEIASFMEVLGGMIALLGAIIIARLGIVK